MQITTATVWKIDVVAGIAGRKRERERERGALLAG